MVEINYLDLCGPYGPDLDATVKAYKDHGFDANQDFPGNVRWEELYNALPKGTKVILTVRDDEKVWFRKSIHFKHSFLVFSQDQTKP